MSHLQDALAMEERRYITLILRLALDPGGQLIHGELVDTTGALPERFIGIVGLNRAVRDWLARQQRPEDPPTP